jgi:hypothetical protein
MLSSTTLLFALAAAGIQWGWEPSAGGGNTYIVQVEPELIDTFRQQGFSSDVPPDLRDIRRIEIRVGSGALPHHGETVLKVNDKDRVPLLAASSAKLGDVSKPPRLDAAAADAAAKHVSSEEPHLADDGPPKSLPKAADAAPLPSSTAKPAEQASFKQGEPKPHDGGSTNSANSTAADREKSSSDGANVAQAPRSPSEADSPPRHEPAETPSIPFLSAVGALVLSAAGNLYLGWAHLGTRRRYREVVGQLRETDLPIAIEPHNEQ